MKAVDTSVLIAAERDEKLREALAAEEALFIPTMAAAEFLVGVRLSQDEGGRLRAPDFYDDLRPFIHPFTESQAQTLASLIAHNRSKGTTMKMFDAAIASAAIDQSLVLLAHDGDFDHLVKAGMLELERL